MLDASVASKATWFRGLHRRGNTFVLPTVWDAASARIFERAGFRALGTTSGGMAFSMGYPDGEPVSRDEMLAAIARIVRAVDVPVSADLEAGYGRTVAEVAETARAAIGIGVVGMILQDWLQAERRFLTIEEQIARIQAVHDAARAACPDFVVNARTEVFLVPPPDAVDRLEEAVRRLRAYREAGADCLFAPGVTDGATIGCIVAAVDGPVNIIPGTDSPPVAELARLGVVRVSLGTAPMRATLGLVERIAEELRLHGTYTALGRDAIPYAELNRVFEARGGRSASRP